MRRATIGWFVGLLGLAGLAGPNFLMAQESLETQPGEVPDFSGLWERPAQEGGRAFRPPANGPGPVMSVPDAGPYRIGDHTSPILLAHAADAVEAFGDLRRAGEIAFPAWSLCMPLGVPLILNLADPTQILQTPGIVVLMNRGDSQVRRVHMNVQMPAVVEPSWYGTSVGHYEGSDTLVVETWGQNDATLIDRFGTPHSESIRVVERYTISSDRSELRVDFTVEDPETFSTPWSANILYREATEPFVEQICAENNKHPDGGNFSIPQDLTPDF